MKNILFLFLASTLFYHCKPETHHPDHEVITKVEYTFISSQDTVLASWSDPDGEGGNSPVIDSIRLRSGRTYKGSIKVSGKVDGKAADLTETIRNEGTAHQFFYNPGTLVTNLVWKVTDVDSKQMPLGLQTEIITPPIEINSTLRVRLSHYDGNKTTEPSSENDIDITFPMRIY